MFKYPSMLVILFFLGGCATTPYGNYVEGNSSTYVKTMADDVAHQLMELYPPASTRFNMQHPTEDSFGVALTKNLRIGGYAVHDYKKSTLTEPIVTAEEGTSLAYILDESNDIYRLLIMIDNNILTRAYMSHGDSIYPAGYWVRKE